MGGHPAHVALIPLVQPALQIPPVRPQIHAAETHLPEAKFATPGAYAPGQSGGVVNDGDFSMAGSAGVKR